MKSQSIQATELRNAAFFSLLKHPFRFRLFLLKKLPAAYFSGLKLRHISEERCSVGVPFTWFTQNPFRSTYFACLSMAAEMSTGILAMAPLYQRKPSASMLIAALESKFYKKAVGETLFTCSDGIAIRQAVEKAFQTGEVQTVTAKSVGINRQNEPVAEFWFTWSFKVRSPIH